MRICLPRHSATETARAYQAVLQKLFPHTPVNEMLNLLDLSRNELIKRIQRVDVLHETHLGARKTGPSPGQAYIDSTKKNCDLLPEERIEPWCRQDAVSSEYTSSGDMSFHPQNCSDCLKISTTSSSRPLPENLKSTETFDAPLPSFPADDPPSRNEQARERVRNMLVHSMAKADHSVETSFEPWWV
jgi:hypothetical protein